MLMWILRQTRDAPFLARTVVTNSPDMPESTEVRVEMMRNHSQFVFTVRPACRLHAGHLTATNKSPQQPDDLKSRTIDTIPVVFAIILGFASLIGVSPRASAQMIVPVDRTLHPPEGFDFGGHWNCRDGSSIAHLEVGNRDRSTGGESLRLPGPWTEIRESQDGFNGNYFVGYDRDKSQFLMIDADDPTSIAYLTEGWNGNRLMLTSTNENHQSALQHRIQFDVNDSHRFTVTWELLEGAAWKAEPAFMCIKADR
jgi:hypothetical protein